MATATDPSGVFAESEAVVLVLLEHAGGGRGVVTARDVKAGEVVLRESPFFRVATGMEAAEGETLHSMVAKEIVRADAGRSARCTRF
jgi:hypothetical protein